LVVVGEEEEREAVVPQPNRRLAHAMDRAVSGVVVGLLVLVEEEELKLVVVEMVLLLVLLLVEKGLKLVVVEMVL
jgi:hypothetical protein